MKWFKRLGSPVDLITCCVILGISVGCLIGGIMIGTRLGAPLGAVFGAAGGLIFYVIQA
jgi:hypothetical protein